MNELKIIVLGDSHRCTENIDLAMETLGNMDTVIHTGDNVEDAKYIENNYGVEVISVPGNCDGSTGDLGDEMITTIKSKKILVCHGHQYGVKKNIHRIYYRAKELGCDIAIFGHTHVPFLEKHDGIIILNPGSISMPRGGSQKSCAVMTIDKAVEIEHLNIG